MTFETVTSNTMTFATVVDNAMTFSSVVSNTFELASCAVPISDFFYSGGGALGISGLASASSATNWLLIDTFTGTDFALLHGTTCDTGQSRSVVFNQSNAIFYNNRGTAFGNATTWTYTALATPPTQVKWSTGDFGDHGLTLDMYFFRSVDGSQSYMIRVNAGNLSIFKNGSPVSWTTGTSTGGYGYTISLTADLTPDTITLTVDDASMGHQVLTYVEVGMPNQTNKTIAIFTGNWIDNLYVR